MGVHILVSANEPGTRLYASRPAIELTSLNENRYHLGMSSDSAPAKPAGNQGQDVSVYPQSDRVLSQQLLGKKGELIIEHEGREYRLRRTQNGKLILTA
jgi:hemin uptake protein HemP